MRLAARLHHGEKASASSGAASGGSERTALAPRRVARAHVPGTTFRHYGVNI